MTKPNHPQPVALINGRVWTGVHAAPEAQAVLMAGDRIAVVGDTASILARAGRGADVIDVEGRRIIPGITDSHTHFLWSGLRLTRLDLRGVRSKVEFIDKVRTAAAALPPGAWLLGGEFAVEHWPHPEKPRKEWIDGVTGDRPAYLTRADLHMALANSAALARAVITRTGPPDPIGGEIERDAGGEPTGLVKDAAMELIQACIPPPTERANHDALAAACRVANRWGITGVHDMSQPAHVEAYRAFPDRGGLTVRITSYVESMDFAATFPTIQRYPKDDPMLRIAGFKAFVDGSLGSRTALMREPYADAAPGAKHPRGLRAKWAADWDAFKRNLCWANDRGMQLAIHAIGDQANHELLDAFAKLPGVRGRRHRVEHAQHLLREDVPRFAELGVIASMQPIHKEDDGPWAESAIGPRRMAMMYAWGDILRANGQVCFGSDVPVATNNPFAGMQMAVTSRLPDGTPCVPEQNIPRDAALRCYTSTPAYAAFRESELGTIAPGKLADIAVLDRDILTIDDDKIGEAAASMTLVGGRVV